MIPLKENWYPDTSDEANAFIWEEMRDRIKKKQVPSLLLHFLHETMRAWYPTGNLVDYVLGLAERFEEQEQAFDCVTNEVLDEAARLMEEWLRLQDEETRESPAMKPTAVDVSNGNNGESGVTTAVTAETQDDTLTREVADAIAENASITSAEGLDRMELNDACAAAAESMHCKEVEQHIPLDSAPIMRMFGPPLPPGMLSDRERLGMDIREHDRPVAVLMERADPVVGPVLVIAGDHHAAIAPIHAADREAQDVALVRCRYDQVYEDGHKRKLSGSDAAIFTSMTNATGGLRRLGWETGELTSRMVLDVGVGRYTVAMAAAAETAVAAGVRPGVYAKPAVGRGGDTPVDRGWLAEYRRRRDKLVDKSYARIPADDARAKRLRARYAWCRDYLVGGTRIDKYKDRAGISNDEDEAGWARAVRGGDLTGAGRWPLADQVAATPAHARLDVRCRVLRSSPTRVVLQLGVGERSFWDLVDGTAVDGRQTIIDCVPIEEL